MTPHRSAFALWFLASLVSAALFPATAFAVTGLSWIAGVAVLFGTVAGSAVNTTRVATARRPRMGAVLLALTVLCALAVTLIAVAGPELASSGSAGGVAIAIASIPLVALSLATALAQLQYGVAPEQHPLGLALLPFLTAAALGYMVAIASASAWVALVPTTPALVGMMLMLAIARGRRQALFSPTDLRTAGAFGSLALTVGLTAQVVAASGSPLIGATLGLGAGLLLAAPAARMLVSVAEKPVTTLANQS